MTKKIIILIIVCSVIFGGLGGWIFIRYVIPKLNTINWLVKYNLAPQTSPLVINTREEIRVNEGSDSIAAIQTAKPWVVGILTGADALSTRIKGSGLIVTSDGLIATSKAVVPDPAQKFYVSFSDGSIAPATLVATDPSSDLVLIKAEKNNLATASLGNTKDLQLGQRIIAINSSLAQHQATDIVSFLSSEPKNLPYDQILSSDRINRTFKVDDLNNVNDGAVVISLNGNAQGIYSNNQIITADAIKSALNSYFKSGKIERVYLGIYYQNISKTAADLYQSTEGIAIKRPDPKTPAIIAQSPAQTFGLVENDVIYAVDDNNISADNSFEDLLSGKNPGDTVKFSVLHGAEKKTIQVTLGKK